MNPNRGAPRETPLAGQACNAWRVTGPLAGAVLGANRLRRSRARRMAPHNPTTGLFQGDGGWFRAGAEDSMTEEGLIEGGDAGS